MKWISQYIQSLIARFRNDVYLENLSTDDPADALGSPNPYCSIGLDSNNKIVKDTTWTVAAGTVGHKIRSLGSILLLHAASGRSMAPGTASMLRIENSVIVDSSTAASGTQDKCMAVSVGINAISATNENVTVTDAASLYLAGAPFAYGDNQTITNAWSLWVDAGDVRFDEDVNINGTLLIAGEIQHIGDINNKIGFGTDTQTFTTGGTSRMDITDSGIRVGSGSRVTTILDEDAMGTNSNTALATQQSIKAYADTKISLSTTKQITFHVFNDNMGTTKQYIGLTEADAENTDTSNKFLPFPAITAGKLIKVALRSNKNLTGHQITFRLEKVGAANPNSATPDILGAQTGAGCNTTTMTTYDFTTGLDSGDGGETNAFSASDLVYLSIQSDTNFGNNVIYYITCIWEFDLS